MPRKLLNNMERTRKTHAIMCIYAAPNNISSQGALLIFLEAHKTIFRPLL